MQKQSTSHNVLDTDRIGPLLLKMTLPLLFGVLVQAAYNIVDAIFIGHYVGPPGMAALSVVFPLFMLTMGLGMMMGVGGASLISRLLGAGDTNGAERALGNSIAIGILISILFTVIVLPVMDFWINLVGASNEVFPLAKDYLIILVSGTVFNVLMNALALWVRAEGNARVSMIIMVLGFGLNILLDAVFIIWLDMGMTGAALAMLISLAIATIYGMSYYFTGSSYLKLRISNFIPDFNILKQILAIGVAQFGQVIATVFATTLLVRTASTYGGDLALASFGIIQRLLHFAIMPGMVIGQGMQPILGFNYGAKRYHLAIKVITLSSIMATIISVLSFTVIFLFPEPIAKAFTNDAQLINETAHVMKLSFLALPLLGFFGVGQMVFPSIGKVIQTLTVAIVRPAVFTIPLVLIMPQFLGLDGVWLAFPTSDALIFIVVVVLLIPVIRQFRKAAAENSASLSGH
jgi:putative MATE family efflux protein